MFRRLNSNKRKIGDCSDAHEQSDRTGPPGEGVVGDTPSSAALPAVSPVPRPVASSSPVTTSSPSSAIGLPPLTPSRLSAGDSLVSPVGFNLVRQSLEFMHKHDSMKGVSSVDLGTNLRLAILDMSKVSKHLLFLVSNIA